MWLVLQETGSLDCFAVCDLAASVGRSCSIVWGCTAPPTPLSLPPSPHEWWPLPDVVGAEHALLFKTLNQCPRVSRQWDSLLRRRGGVCPVLSSPFS